MPTNRLKPIPSARSITSSTALGRTGARQQIESGWRRREIQNQQQQTWSEQKNYYDNYTRRNSQYQFWTSAEQEDVSLGNYKKMKDDEKRRDSEEAERNNQDLIKFKKKQEQEIAEKEEERLRNLPWRLRRKADRTDVQVLADVNARLKAEEEVSRRHESEIKLFEQWKNDHPILQNQQRQTHSNNLKLAWLDAQVEKQMKREEEKKELDNYLAERDKQQEQEKQLDMEHEKQNKSKVEEINQIIQSQMDLVKLKENISKELKKEENETIRHRCELEDLQLKRSESIRQLRNAENNLYNLQQYRLRLRRHAKAIAEEIEVEHQIYDKLNELNAIEGRLDNDAKQIINAMLVKINECLAQQKTIEKQRDDYLSLIFDSEAKSLWDKHARDWKREQEARDRLFNEVMDTWRKQIQEAVNTKNSKQKELDAEKETILKQVEEANKELEMIEKQKTESKVQFVDDLDKQVLEKELRKKYLDDVDKVEREKKLEQLRLEEERLRKEISQLQLNTNQSQQRDVRRRIVW